MKQKTPFKERLKEYQDILAEIKLEEQRAKLINDDGSLTGRRAIAGIKDHLRKLLDKEQDEYEALVDIINALPCVEERQVILARYMDGMAWETITMLMFGRNKNFYEKKESYQRRIYRIHGNALSKANRIMETKKERE